LEELRRVKDSEVWLIGCDIPEYIDANQFNHRPSAAEAVAAPPRSSDLPIERWKRDSPWCVAALFKEGKPSCSWDFARARPSTTSGRP